MSVAGCPSQKFVIGFLQSEVCNRCLLSDICSRCVRPDVFSEMSVATSSVIACLRSDVFARLSAMGCLSSSWIVCKHVCSRMSVTDICSEEAVVITNNTIDNYSNFIVDLFKTSNT